MPIRGAVAAFLVATAVMVIGCNSVHSTVVRELIKSEGSTIAASKTSLEQLREREKD